MRQHQLLTEGEIASLCREWQQRLNIQYWKIETKICRQRDMILKECSAEVSWKLMSCSAIIRILDPVDYPGDWIWPQNMEKDLVHELLHLRFAECDKTAEDSLEEKLFDRSINEIAEALVGLKYGK